MNLNKQPRLVWGIVLIVIASLTGGFFIMNTASRTTITTPSPKPDLMAAIASRNIAELKPALEDRIDLNLPGPEGDLPLTLAARVGSPEIVKLLLENHAAINGKNINGQTALSAAIFAGNTQIAKLLIERNADVNIPDQELVTALMYSAIRGSHEIAALLLQRGANVNAASREESTPLV
jgi:ankyrin repeat protein